LTYNVASTVIIKIDGQGPLQLLSLFFHSFKMLNETVIVEVTLRYQEGISNLSNISRMRSNHPIILFQLFALAWCVSYRIYSFHCISRSIYCLDTNPLLAITVAWMNGFTEGCTHSAS